MGRPRHPLMTRFLRRGTADDNATQCALQQQHVRKLSLDASSVASDDDDDATTASTVLLSERSLLPQHLLASERSYASDINSSASNDFSTLRRVGFGNVQVRLYEEVIGDHPHCSSGCPLSLGWNYVQQEPESITDYEDHKEHTRKQDELRLSDQERHDRLMAMQVSDMEIRRSLRRLHRERECSVKCQMKAKAQFFL